MAHVGHSHGGSGCDHDHGSAGAGAPLAAAEQPAPQYLSGAARDLPLLRAGDEPADSLRAEFIRAEALYHHIVDGTPIASCETGSEAAAAACDEHRLPHDNARHTRDALAAFLRCADLIHREGIFSSNEELSDVSTEDLQYLLCEFYVASLRQRAPISSGSGGPVGIADQAPLRLQQLKTARSELEAFLAACAGMGGLVSAEEAAAIGLLDIVPYLREVYGGGRGGGGSGSRRVGGGSGCADGGGPASTAASLTSSARARQAAEALEEAERAAAADSADSTLASTSLSRRSRNAGGIASPAARAAAGAAPRVDPAAQRAQKIERFKRSAAAGRRLRELAALNARSVEAARRRGMDTEAAVEASLLDGIGASLGGPPVDDEMRREMSTLALRTAVRTALDDIVAVDQELPLLQHMVRSAAAAAAGTGASRGGNAAGRDDARTPGGAAGAAGAGGGGSSLGVPDASGRTGPPPGDPSIDPHRKGLEVYRIDPTYTVARETVRAGVFNDPFPAPSMELGDWGDVVTAKRVEREAREAVQAASHGRSLDTILASGLEGEGAGGVPEAEFDAAVAHKRAFDDWADGVPKGAGVTKRI